MKLKYMMAAAGGAILITAMTGCKHKSQSDAEAEGAAPIEVSEVMTDSLTLYKEYPGTLTANSSADVVARVNGFVSGPLYEGGTYVKKGQVLYTIQSPDYVNALNSAKANLTKAKSDNEYAEQHYEAVQRAYEKNAVSQMELAQALNAREQSRAAIKSAEVAVNDAQLNVSRCTVTAPISGRASTNAQSSGSYVSGQMSPVVLATIYQDQPVIANFTIEDDSFLRMFNNPNNRHLIDYDSIPISFQEELPHEYTGALYYISPNVNASTGTMILKARIDNPYQELRTGMYCNIRMPYKVDPKAMIIRDASISTDQLGKFVYVVNDSNKVVYTPIQVGDLANDSMRIVTEGLKPGDKYVTAAMLKVRDGMTVKPILTK